MRFGKMCVCIVLRREVYIYIYTGFAASLAEIRRNATAYTEQTRAELNYYNFADYSTGLCGWYAAADVVDDSNDDDGNDDDVDEDYDEYEKRRTIAISVQRKLCTVVMCGICICRMNTKTSHEVNDISII